MWLVAEESEAEGRGPGFLERVGVDVCSAFECLNWGCIPTQEAAGDVGLELRG